MNEFVDTPELYTDQFPGPEYTALIHTFEKLEKEGASLDPAVKIWDFPVSDGINHVVARTIEEAIELLYATEQYEADKAPYRYWWKERQQTLITF